MAATEGIPLAHVARDLQQLDTVALREKYGPLVLVWLHACTSRQGPRVAHQTVRHAQASSSTVGDDLMRIDTAPFQLENELLVFPVRKRPDSQLPFVSIGRIEGNDIVLPSEGVSKFHAYIKPDPSGTSLALLQDGRSTNGTFVDGERVARRGEGPARTLRAGAQVRFGNISMVLLDLDGLVALARGVESELVRVAS